MLGRTQANLRDGLRRTHHRLRCVGMGSIDNDCEKSQKKHLPTEERNAVQLLAAGTAQSHCLYGGCVSPKSSYKTEPWL